MKRTLLPVLALALATTASAQSTIYKCVAADGGTVISNAKVDKSCKPVVIGHDNSLSGYNGASAKPKVTGATANPTPSGFPRVAEDQQKARDNDRRRILEQEITNEQKNLEQAKRELAEQEAVRHGDEKNYQRLLDRLQPYKDRVAQHERNIQAINRELTNLK